MRGWCDVCVDTNAACCWQDMFGCMREGQPHKATSLCHQPPAQAYRFDVELEDLAVALDPHLQAIIC